MIEVLFAVDAVENKKFLRSIHRGILFKKGILLGSVYFFAIRTGLKVEVVLEIPSTYGV